MPRRHSLRTVAHGTLTNLRRVNPSTQLFLNPCTPASGENHCYASVSQTTHRKRTIYSRDAVGRSRRTLQSRHCWCRRGYFGGLATGDFDSTSPRIAAACLALVGTGTANRPCTQPVGTIFSSSFGHF